MRNRIVTWLYPSAFGVSYVLLTLSELPTTLADLVRPSVLVIGATLLVAAFLSLVLRSRHRAAIATSVIAVAASAPFLLASAVGAGVLVVVVQVLRRRWTLAGIRAASAATVSRGVGVFAWTFLLVAVVVATPAAIGSVPTADRSSVEGASAEYPNTYLIVLDGYPRGDTLASLYGHDNRPFESDLEQRGFMVASESRSNYAHSWLTLSSMFHGAYADAIPGLLPAPSTPSEQFRSLMGALNDGEMVDLLRARGYEISAIPPPFRSLALSTADRYLDGGQLTDFEYSLLTNSQLGGPVLALFPDFLADQQRDRFHAARRQIAAFASESRDGPRFLFAHLFSPPHAPLIYGADGEELPLSDCVPDKCSLWEFPDDAAWDGLGGQVTYVNAQLLATIDEVVAADPDAVIVLMSDHGSRRSRDDIGEYFRTFFAARTPGQDPFPSDNDPVNVLRRLADAYLGTNLGALPYESWYSPIQNLPLNLEPFNP